MQKAALRGPKCTHMRPGPSSFGASRGGSSAASPDEQDPTNTPTTPCQRARKSLMDIPALRFIHVDAGTYPHLPSAGGSPWADSTSTVTVFLRQTRGKSELCTSMCSLNVRANFFIINRTEAWLQIFALDGNVYGNITGPILNFRAAFSHYTEAGDRNHSEWGIREWAQTASKQLRDLTG